MNPDTGTPSETSLLPTEAIDISALLAD